jgi:hypothetical protein
MAAEHISRIPKYLFFEYEYVCLVRNREGVCKMQ